MVSFMGMGNWQELRLDREELGSEGLRNQKVRVEPPKDYRKSRVIMKSTVE